MFALHAERHVHGLRFTVKVFAPFYSEKQDYCRTKIGFLSKTGVRNGKYRNPEDSGRNMQPNKTKKKPWHWDEVHQKAFDNVKATVVKDVTLAYPDFTKPFEIYTDASKRQLGSMITQNNKPIAFFTRKLW